MLTDCCWGFLSVYFEGLSEAKAAGAGGPDEWPPALKNALQLMRQLQKENPR